MSLRTFGSTYADQYDILYQDKDYESECDLLKEVFSRCREGETHSILDMGCGTGNHALPLARRGYQVTGVDCSSAMLAHAARKIREDPALRNSPNPALVEGDVRTIELGRFFDAVLMMFAVLGYQISNQDVLASLRGARRHLEPGGLLVFDVWYGPAVLAIGPSERAKVISDRGGQVIRIASGSLDSRHHLCTVNYRLWRLANGTSVREVREQHTMRYFFPMELEAYLSQCEFALCGLHPFGSLDGEVDVHTWNVLACARAV